MSQSSISRCLHQVTDAINELIFRQWVQFPVTPQARHVAREKFLNACQPFEGAIGAIDCTHVAILAPKVHEEAYVNHDGYHSINVQMVHIIVTLCMRNRDIFIYPLLIHNTKLFYRYVIQI